METKQDEEFGAMTEAQTEIVGGWRLERGVLFAGAPVPIIAEPDEDGGCGFDTMQRVAVRLALALGPGAAKEAAGTVVQLYEIYRAAIGDGLPQLERPADVWRQVRIGCIWVPRHYDAQHAYFLIEAECDWDPSHDLEIRFRNGVAIESDQALGTGGAQDDTPEQLDELRQLIADAMAQFSHPDAC